MKRWGWFIVTLVVIAGVIGFLAMQRRPVAKKETGVTVKRGSIDVHVVESGVVEALQVVEVKSRVGGRVKKIFFEEGDTVHKGDLIAIIDPQETELQVQQNRAQLRGAQAGVARLNVEIAQRRETSRAQLEQARIRLAQLELEMKSQPTLTSSAIESAKSALASAQQARRQMVEATHPNERTQIQAEVDQADASLSNAKVELARQERLKEQQFASGRDVENQKLQVDLAQSRATAVRDRLRRLENQHRLEIQTADERIRQAKADLARSQANTVQDRIKSREVENARVAVRQAATALRDVDALIASKAQSSASVDQLRSILSDSERQLGETEIRAPRDGVITKKLVQEGELVSSLNSFSSGTPIVRLEDRSTMIVKLNINEIDVAKLKLGMESIVNIDALPTKKFTGSVSKIAPAKSETANAADPVVRYQVEVRLNEADEQIKSGMTAKCSSVVETKKNVLVVPVEYLVKEEDKRFVMIPNAKKGLPPEKKEIRIGTEAPGSVEVLDGVKEGDKIELPPYTGPNRRGMGFNAE